LRFLLVAKKEKYKRNMVSDKGKKRQDGSRRHDMLKGEKKEWARGGGGHKGK
jgi:hypothetical protein